ncbi:MAG: DUF255 domain-containing protein [Betaproteobacteria bacterium]
MRFIAARPLVYAFLALSSLSCTVYAARMPGAPQPEAPVAGQSSIVWHDWSEDLFAQAKREKRYILLDLEAVWCHWCHVMEKTTYQDPKVTQLIGKHYIAIRADQDARPDLSRRYDEYGWPATVVFAPDGTEIVKRRGYIPPERMGSLLQAIVKDPTPMQYRDQAGLDTFSRTPILAAPLEKELRTRFIKTHDFALGGLDQEQRFLDHDAVEYQLMQARKGDAQARTMATQDLNGAMALIDPVWGGMYQYSTDRDWQHPHYEKILAIQAEAIRLYALGAMTLNHPAYIDAAKNIHRYVTQFLSGPEGAFYVSQDADVVRGEHSADYFALNDAARRKRGMPAIDKHLYSREQGWMAQALVQLYSATLDQRYLQQAVAALDWAVVHRALPAGGFRHDESDAAGPYLEDTLAMGRGMLAAYTATGDRKWLARSEAAGRFVKQTFAAPQGAGYLTAVDRRQVLKPKPQIDENLAAARFFNLLARYTGNEDYAAQSQRAMRYLVTREVALLRSTEPGILIADFEVTSDPVHLTIVGPKDDPNARALFESALRYPASYRRIEWWDRREGAMPNADVQYPELAKAAAFVCTSGACSLPQFEPGQIITLAERLDGVSK